ncbi:P-loop containing nucleoside triphosphate hydrolase protein [Hyaloraphidium curvatum]|nr:P-loop containing nucleoside triphosphate hydrolase protein [Hyaloraphidium curvatum]
MPALQVASAELDFFGDAKVAEPTVVDDGAVSGPVEGDAATSDSEGAQASLDTPKDVEEFRRRHRIRIHGTDVPNPVRSFEELFERFKVKAYLRKNVAAANFAEPSPIQMQATTISIHGREIIACAPTGSGKTLAFLLPILHDLRGPTKEGFRAVIISPTRELAQQTYRHLQNLSKGKPFRVCLLTQIANLENPKVTAQFGHFDILIATPLRLVHALKHDSLKLDKVRHLVLDEADQLLDLGFLDQIDEIFAACTNPKVVRSLYSATIPSSVEELATSIMKDPIRVVIGHKNAATETIEQKLLFVGSEEGKLLEIRRMIKEGFKPPVLVFVQSIDRAKELFHELVFEGINVDVMHSERTKAQRDAIVQSFRTGALWVLICTELMARGIDFKGVNLVVNYDFPQTVQSYIHRIGRTGRAGRSGRAVTFFTKEDAPYLKSIVNVMRESGCEVPEWMLRLEKPSKLLKRLLKKRAPARARIDTRPGFDRRKAGHKKQVISQSKSKQKHSKGGADRSTRANGAEE